MKPGEQLELADIKITVVPAYNIDKDFHPKTKEWLGFIVEIRRSEALSRRRHGFYPGNEGF